MENGEVVVEYKLSLAMSSVNNPSSIVDNLSEFSVVENIEVLSVEVS